MNDFTLTPSLKTLDHLTISDYLAQYGESSKPVQLINGQVVFLGGATNLHASVITQLIWALLKIIEPQNLGELRTYSDLYLDDLNYYQPDLFFVAKDNSRCYVGQDGYWHGAPDLVIEVHSKSTVRYDRVEKFEVYERHGVREYWMVDPELRMVEVYTLDVDGLYNRRAYADDAVMNTPVFPQLNLTVTAIFPPL